MAIDSGLVGLLALGAGTVLEGLGMAWWAGSTNNKIHTLETAIKPIAGLGKDMVRLEERVGQLIDLLQEIDPPRHPRRRAHPNPET